MQLGSKYSGDLNTEHLKSGFIRNLNKYGFGFRAMAVFGFRAMNRWLEIGTKNGSKS